MSVMENVKERPILFSTEMVKAILDGRKTMTRRVMNPQPVKAEGLADDGNDLWIWVERKRYGAVTSWAEPDTMTDKWTLDTCPYGKVGDRLWVRETWRAWCHTGVDQVPHYQYRASMREDMATARIWKPSIFMPRAASRILLEVTGVRVERVQDISERDSVSEGCLTQSKLSDEKDWSFRGGFRNLWNAINEARGYGWDTNCWVWVVEFKRIEAAADGSTPVSQKEGV